MIGMNAIALRTQYLSVNVVEFQYVKNIRGAVAHLEEDVLLI